MCATLAVVSKEIISFIPSIELVSFLLIMYGLHFERREAVLISVIFCFVQTILYGFGMWTIMYFIVWPGLVLLTGLLKKYLTTYSRCAIYSAIFGLVFGFLFSIPYFITSLSYGWIYFLRGLPFDLVHAIGNYIIMLILFDKVNGFMEKQI